MPMFGMSAVPDDEELEAELAKLERQKAALIDLFSHFKKVRNSLDPDDAREYGVLFQLHWVRFDEEIERITLNL
jgi:hypothetical protein